MLRCSSPARSFQRGAWGPGAKHQKHVSMNPTTYLYRFPGPKGPGPYTMKYWWTLGCFPTGLSTPFRINEFLSTYQQQHVPLEVEEWLDYYVTQPNHAIKTALDNLLSILAELPDATRRKNYIDDSTCAAIKDALHTFERQYGVTMPLFAVRTVLNDPVLGEKFRDDLYDFREAVTTEGSTHHRRLARYFLEADDNVLPLSSTAEMPSENTKTAVQAVIATPEATATDEQRIINVLTTLAEGCAKKHNYDLASSVLSSSLAQASDEGTRATVHANIASAALMAGDVEEAQYHGREAALLQPVLRKQQNVAKRGYLTWSKAVAYQDDYEKADSILSSALSVYPDDRELLRARAEISDMQSAGKNAIGRTSATRQRRGIERGTGRSFDNDHDWVSFRNKLYPSKMDPRTNEMGSVFRRVGDLGGHISTSQVIEKI